MIAALVGRDKRFTMYHVQQSLMLVIAAIVTSAAGVVPIIGWFSAPLLAIGLVILWIIGFVHAISGQARPIPLIGEWALKFNLVS